MKPVTVQDLLGVGSDDCEYDYHDYLRRAEAPVIESYWRVQFAIDNFVGLTDDERVIFAMAVGLDPGPMEHQGVVEP